MAYAIPDQITAANKAGIETLLTLANTVFASTERLAALNLNIARTVIEDSVSSTKGLLGVKDPQELLGYQTSLAQPAVEKAVAYSRSLYEIASQTQEEVGKIFEAQFVELNKTLNVALDQVTKNAPAGSDAAVAALKSTIAAANSAYDSVSKVVKQVSEMAEANVAAATNATVKAAGAAGAKSKKTAA
ncbi:MAG: phasin family protein [Georgfuchsia sp.]